MLKWSCTAAATVGIELHSMCVSRVQVSCANNGCTKRCTLQQLYKSVWLALNALPQLSTNRSASRVIKLFVKVSRNFLKVAVLYYKRGGRAAVYTTEEGSGQEFSMQIVADIIIQANPQNSI